MSEVTFLDILRRAGGAPSTPAGGEAPVPPRISAATTTYGSRALQQEVDLVATTGEGGRNHALNRAAFNVSQLINAGHIAPADAWTALRAAARACGLPDPEIDATLKSAWAGAGSKPRTVVPDPDAPAPEPPPVTLLRPHRTSPEPDADVDASATPQGPTLDELVHARLPLIDWQQLWDDDAEEEWILEPILPARRLVALYSPPKVGKSLLMLELAVAVAAGTEALGTSVDRPRRVLYVDFENDPKADVRARLQAMGRTPADLTNLCYLSFPTLAGLDSEVGSQELMAAIQVYGCEVVVVDTVSRSVAGEENENENDTWLSFYRHTGLKLKQAGVSLIRLDHAGKDESKGQRGGSAKVGDVDAVWKLSRVAEHTFQLYCEHARMPVAEKVLVLHREALPHLHHRVDGSGRSAAFEATVNAVIDALDGAELPPDTGRDKARALLRTTGVKAGTGAIEEAVRRRKSDAGIYLLEGVDDV